ncbi:hypothetical protein KR222_008488 [Zaprionus bogoriensis]|nr:hypothetical protein KR222_008488 [Zaprionus bogoriensis]
MTAVRPHATDKGFCLCHLLCVWRVTGKLGLLLGYYNVSYSPHQGEFVCDEQLYVHLMALGNLLTCLAYLWLSQRWVYDPLVFLLYAPLYLYFLKLRHHRIRLLNECAGLQARLEHALGSWLCVTLRKECLLALLLPLELLLLLGWQCKMYSSYQFCFIASLALVYHLQLLFLGNYLLWLASLYRAFNEFLLQHMASSRLRMLRAILRREVLIWRVHSRVVRYFSLHLLSFVASVLLRVYRQLLERTAHNRLSVDRLQLIHIALLLSVLITLLLTAQDLQQQRQLFQLNLLRMKDRPEYFELKSWCLLKPFGLRLLRRVARPQQKRDVITMLLSSNLPVTELRRRALPLASLLLGLQLSLPQLRQALARLGYMLLLALGQHLLQHTHLLIRFRSWRGQGNFDANVTQTISQVYRWYSYDELD